ncbi:SPRY domain-containing SOCS box protein 2 [Hypomesus transpacificus]|uniref:SPRY domain-containing SOCS box protein 2 n=1 Tax=Hypomesus transpacificus TaxID=137520 RepID=UPI001F083B17|nr:SPRY domain-containing SOCS box protein 2 [Hypomesus transpacificus]
MGLTLSHWLHGTSSGKPSSSSSSSSSFRPLATPPSSRLSLMLHSSPADAEDRRSCWSPTHCSPHFRRSGCGQEVTRAPAQQSSDGVRGERGERRGLHLWEVLWSPTHRGSHAVVGISTSCCPLQASGYTALVGGDSESWGWELTSNQLWHKGQVLGVYPRGRRQAGCCPKGPQLVEHWSHTQTGLEDQGPASALTIPERVLLVLDADAGTLGYIVDGCFLGVAFCGLPKGAELFPAVSSVRGGAVVRLRYLNGANRDAPKLMALCGLSIRQSMGNQRGDQTARLPLPPLLQHYLLPSL